MMPSIIKLVLSLTLSIIPISLLLKVHAYESLAKGMTEGTDDHATVSIY